MARQIGKMLNAREPKIVNGPEILSKFVGASEENIRKLFADAEKEVELDFWNEDIATDSHFSTNQKATRAACTSLSLTS